MQASPNPMRLTRAFLQGKRSEKRYSGAAVPDGNAYYPGIPGGNVKIL